MIHSTPKRRGKTYVMKFNVDKLTTYVLAATRLIGNEPKTSKSSGSNDQKQYWQHNFFISVSRFSVSHVENITNEQILNDKIPNNSFNFTNDINLKPKIASTSSDASNNLLEHSSRTSNGLASAGLQTTLIDISICCSFRINFELPSLQSE